MRQHVIVIPSDHVIIVDGQLLRFEFVHPSDLHALQWHDGKGHIEFTEADNVPLSDKDAYQKEVAPYVSMWEAEQRRLAEGANRTLTQKEKDEQRRIKIITRFVQIDADSVRPLRAIVKGEGTEDDKEKLTALDAEAEELRAELATLSSAN